MSSNLRSLGTGRRLAGFAILLAWSIAFLILGSPALGATIILQTAWALPNEALLDSASGSNPASSALTLNVGVSLFDPNLGTLNSYANQVDWTTSYQSEGTLNFGDAMNTQVTQYTVWIGTTQLDHVQRGSGGNLSWSSNDGNSGTTSWGAFPANPTGAGVVNMPVSTTVSAGCLFNPLTGESATIQGYYTGFFTVTYNYTPANPWTGGSGGGGGGWVGGGGWGGGSGTPPNAACAVAYFGPGASTYNITLDQDVTVGTVIFDSSTSYTISGSHTLTIDCSNAQVIAALGSHTIAVPMHYATSANVMVSNASDTLTTSGAMTSASGITLTKQGPGTWVAKHVRTGTLDIQEGKVQMIADQTVDGTSIVNALSVNDGAGAKLDINQNHVIIDYASGNSPYAEVKRLLKSGRNGGAWNGAGINSSAVAAHSGTTTAIGYAEASTLSLTSFGGETVDSTSVLMRWTLGGDANLDGTVNNADYARLSAHFNGSGDWTEGDFNYDGIVNNADYAILTSNWNTSLPTSAPLPASAVPEPSSAGTMLLALLMPILKRRRKSSNRFCV